MVGEDHEVGVRVGFDLDGLPAELRASCEPLPTDAPRAEVVAADAALDSARSAHAQARAGYLPSLEVTSGLAAVTTDPGFGRFATWNIAAVLSMPIWEGGARDGLVRERAAAVAQAEVGVESARRSDTVEVRHARRVRTSTEAVLASAREARDLAREQDRLTRRSYEIGRATSLDLVVSAAALRSTELNVALRELEWVQAGLDLFLSTAECKK